MGAVAARPRIEGEGTSGRVWQAWLPALACADMAPVAGLLPAQRLVVVAPHPDDEVLACGALIAMHARQGGEVRVVAVTDGEASHAEVSALRPGELAVRRRAERLQGLARLGVGTPRVHALALPDGRVQAHAGALLRGLLDALCPGDVVVSTCAFDGHPDHDATGDATRQACLQRGCRWLAAPVWMWHWAATGDARVPWHRLQRLTLSDDARLRKQAALAAHVSQLTPRSPVVGPVLGAHALERAAWRHEYYFV